MMYFRQRFWLPGVLAAGVIGSALLGCGPWRPAVALGDGKNDPKSTPAEEPGTTPKQEAAEVAKLSADNYALAFDLYTRLGKAKPDANLAFSPHSIAEVMVLPYRGAQGDTAAQIAAALHYSLPAARLPAALGALDQTLVKGGDDGKQPRQHRVGLKVHDGEGGVLIEDVVADSPADKAGLKKGQLIVSVEGQHVRNAADFNAALADLPGEAFSVETSFLRHSVKPYRIVGPRPTVSVYNLTTANAVWTRKDLPLRPEFLAAAGEFGAAVEDLDFSKPDDARQTINDWVAHKTNFGVKELFPAGAVKPDVGLVLTNALYFRALWDQEFKPDSTHSTMFYGPDKPSRVPMMEQTGTFRIYSSSDFKIIELPFSVGDVVLDLILPDKSLAFAEFEKGTFNAESLAEWQGKLREKEVRLKLPRFKAASQFDLKDALTDMGVKLAFDAKADFSGVTDSKELAIGAVVHQASLEVEERGATASAASGVSLRPKSIKQEDTTFIADHPFLFVLRDKATNIILMMGRVKEPEKAQ